MLRSIQGRKRSHSTSVREAAEGTCVMAERHIRWHWPLLMNNFFRFLPVSTGPKFQEESLQLRLSYVDDKGDYILITIAIPHKKVRNPRIHHSNILT